MCEHLKKEPDHCRKIKYSTHQYKGVVNVNTFIITRNSFNHLLNALNEHVIRATSKVSDYSSTGLVLGVIVLKVMRAKQKIITTERIASRGRVTKDRLNKNRRAL